MKALKSETIWVGAAEALTGLSGFLLPILNLVEQTDLDALTGGNTKLVATILLVAGVLQIVLRYTCTKPVSEL